MLVLRSVECDFADETSDACMLSLERWSGVFVWLSAVLVAGREMVLVVS